MDVEIILPIPQEDYELMRTTLTSVIAAAFSMTALSAQATTSTGAGATFPAPVYAKWADSYQKETGNKLTTKALVPLVVKNKSLPNTVDLVLLMRH